MPQVFPRSSNTIARAGVLGVAFLVLAIPVIGVIFVWSPIGDGIGDAPAQPVFFSHRVHVATIGIDCRYCHASVETSSFAGMPATETCLNCHSQILTESPLLEPVRESFRTGQPLHWTRVYHMPDFVYFDHSIHVHKGIGYTTCHGRVDQMPLLTQKLQPMTMGWCLECHRHPEKYVRPRDQVFNLDWQPPEDQLTLGRRLVEEYGIETATSCSICHR